MPMTLQAPIATVRPCARPVRVSFFIDNLGRAGTESQLLALLRTLDRSRVEPALVLLDGESEASRELEPPDCPILRLGVKKLLGRGAYRAAQQLRRFWIAQRPDIAQIYFLDSAYFGVPVAKLAGVPHIVRVRNNLSYWLTRKHRLLNRAIRPFVNATLTNSEAGRAALMERDCLPAERIEVIENGVDLERFALPGRRPFSESTIRIGCVANLRPVKNIDGLLRAAAVLVKEFPKLHFDVAGEGEQRPALEKLHSESGLGERFRFLGSVREIPEFLGGLDLAVLPSHSEGMSNALLEYMAAGRPIVATDVGANATVLDGGHCGAIAATSSDGDLIAAIRRVLADPVSARRCGASARLRVESESSRDAMRLRFEEFYLKLAGVSVG